MLSAEELRRAAEAGLAYLEQAEGVREAEIFVAANGSLLTRLNYTSHIPSNGVEEPKSTSSYGVGVQAVFETPEGVKVGFGSEPSDVSQEGVASALEKARKGAVLDPEFTSLARPTGERRTLYDYHDPALMDVRDEDLVGAGWRVVERGLETFSSSEKLKALVDGVGNLRNLGLIVGGDVTILQERIAIASHHLPEVQTDESTLMMSFITSMVERKDAKGSGWQTATVLAGFNGEAGEQAANNAIAAMDGRRVKDGVYTVIFGKQPVTDLLNNLILPGLTLSTFYMAGSPFMGKLGQRIASEKLSIYDDGSAPGLMGSKGITCEGLPTGRTQLIANGVMVGTLSNYYETQRILQDVQAVEKLGVDPRQRAEAIVPRNGFRFGTGGGRNFDTQPGIAPTNVVVEGSDDLGLDDLIARVDHGLYVGRIWYTYPINGLRAGDFTCTVVGDSFIIENGRIVAPLKANTVRINDNIHNILENITGISRDRKATLVWAADEVVHAPEIAVNGVHVYEIGQYLEAGG